MKWEVGNSRFDSHHWISKSIVLKQFTTDRHRCFHNGEGKILMMGRMQCSYQKLLQAILPLECQSTGKMSTLKHVFQIFNVSKALFFVRLVLTYLSYQILFYNWELSTHIVGVCQTSYEKMCKTEKRKQGWCR